MSEKKSIKQKPAHPAKDENRNKRQEESNDRSKALEAKKARRVNYIVKDLPIY